MEEVLLASKFDDTKRLFEILSEAKSRMQAAMTSAGHSTALIRTLSYFSPTAAVAEQGTTTRQKKLQ